MQEKDSGLDLVSKGEIPKRVTHEFAGLRGGAGRRWRAGRSEATLSPGDKEQWFELWAERRESTDRRRRKMNQEEWPLAGAWGHGGPDLDGDPVEAETHVGTMRRCDPGERGD